MHNLHRPSRAEAAPDETAASALPAQVENDRASYPKTPIVRTVILLTLPALLVGVALRVWFCRAQPYGSYNSDVLDFLDTTLSLRHGAGFVIHWKKTFLVPVVYWLFSLSGAALVATIPVFQHVLGCAMIVMAGLLGAMLLRFWKIFVPLLTLLFAVAPSLLYYEHELMAESLLGFCVVGMALAAACYTRSRSWASLATLVAAVFFAAGARPEGKLFALFPLLLVAWTERHRLSPLAARCGALLSAVALAALLNPHANESGTLLLTSVVQLAPDELRSAPDFSPLLRPIRDRAARDWQEFDRNGLKISPNWHADKRKTLFDLGVKYLHVEALPQMQRWVRVNRFLLKIGTEICLRRPFFALGVIAKKAMCTISDVPGLVTKADRLHDKQSLVLINDASSPEYSSILFGKELRTPEEARDFVEHHYPAEVPWYNALRAAWKAALNKGALPRKQWKFAGVVWPGIPPLYLAALLGMVVAALRKHPLQPWFISLAVTLTAISLLIFLTGNVRPRFRFFLEPFWMLYVVVLCDFLASKIWSAWRKAHPAR